MNADDEILSVKNVYKVFGQQPDAAIKMLEEGKTKEDVFQETGQVIGVFDATFSVKRGEIFVIMGLSGSGKSTMVRLFNRLIEPTSGSIFLKGKEITGLTDKGLLDVRRKDMSMVFQSFALMPHMTVLDNAAFGLEVSGVVEEERCARAREALSQVGLAGHEYSYPHQLSGGMQQRVGLARALTNDPTILLMDEAFSALDPLIRTEMQDELLRLQKEQQRTIIFISHDLDEAIRIGDRIAIMEGGCVVQIGTPQEILNNPATPYVESFFKSVDSSKVLRAGDVARLDADIVVHHQQTPTQTPTQTPPSIPYAYMMDDQQQFMGIIDNSHPDGSGKALTLLPSDVETIAFDTPLHELLGLSASLPYPLPVLNADGTLNGTISRQSLLQSLSRH
ncbi:MULTISPECIES: quaternary amine ABC transporter ATP-binding protein [Cobetia]|uniref:quaternary amine ABC transporter ATP-binding protein n=1 Tax=Cobetia TaxID=204286 RepID=UPI0006CA511A|nr:MULTISPECIES: glycine betaine/L-proline ABC transporter ATP-binding protein [Cobetia]KPM80467.1 glycine/betaine ABC transporter ATP-binding protein [Cobetia sp. UCD-24C]MDO6814241.1 glycine betaine/L-proline ABC transporter ATP-binding protein [Cobetia amphilecti]